ENPNRRNAASVRRDGRGNEPGQVGLRFLQIRQIQVHHVAGGVGVEREILQERRVHIQMIEGVARGEQRRRQIVVAARHVYPKERIAREGVGQRLSHINVTVALVPIPASDGGEHLVGQVRLIFQFGADVGVEGGGKGAGNRFVTGVLFHAV